LVYIGKEKFTPVSNLTGGSITGGRSSKPHRSLQAKIESSNFRFIGALHKSSGLKVSLIKAVSFGRSKSFFKE
jgi:hypothetical protein